MFIFCLQCLFFFMCLPCCTKYIPTARCGDTTEKIISYLCYINAAVFVFFVYNYYNDITIDVHRPVVWFSLSLSLAFIIWHFLTIIPSWNRKRLFFDKTQRKKKVRLVLMLWIGRYQTFWVLRVNVWNAVNFFSYPNISPAPSFHTPPQTIKKRLARWSL